MNKVYCGDCKHHRGVVGGIDEMCNMSCKVVNNYYEEYLVGITTPKVKNKHNDCKDYEAK